jgi:hypothetical protein
MNKLAFDSNKSQRKTDDNGFLQIDKTNISKAVVNPYYGKEIPRFDELGLDPETVYQLLRHPDELKKAASTFNNLPVLSEHIPVFSEKPPVEKIIGSTGSDAEFDGTYLTCSMSIWEGNAIRLIEADAKKELSSAYLYDADMTSGEYNGTRYDGVMRNIRGNHVAVVESGRAGSDVVVADSNPFKTLEDNDMKLTKKGLARLTLFRAATMQPKLAMDGALLNAAKIDKAAIKKALIAMDISPDQLDNILDAVIGVEDSPEPVDIEQPAPPMEGGAGDGEEGSPHDKLSAFLTEKGMGADDIETAKSFFESAPAQDEDEVEIDIKDDEEESPKAAMDSALKAQENRLMKRFKDIEQAKADVRTVVGEVMGMDSAELIYKFALKQIGVKHDGVNELAGLRAVLKASQSAAAMAQDSKQASTKTGRAELVDAIPSLKNYL